MLAKLFTTADGKIPFLQIIIGVVIGAVAMFLYAKFYKPKILFPESNALVDDLLLPAPPNLGKNTPSHQVRPPVATVSVSGPVPMEATTAAQPSFLNLGDIAPPHMPKLPGVYKHEEESEEEEDDDDDSEEDEDEEQRGRMM